MARTDKGDFALESHFEVKQWEELCESTAKIQEVTAMENLARRVEGVTVGMTCRFPKYISEADKCLE